MSRRIWAVLAVALALGLSGSVARADDAADTKAVVDKAIKALGGEEALAKAKNATWKSKTTITFNGADNEGTTVSTMQGVDHFRQEIEGQFGGNKFKGVTVLAGDKGARKFGDNRADFDKAALANQKRTVYLTVIPITLLDLRSKDFKLEPAGELKVDDKPAVGIKVTGPDMKDFKLYFDKDSGLPVRMVANAPGFQGDEYMQETTFSDYKEMGGIKKATKVVSKRNGEKFITQEISDFKTLDKVDPKTFTEVE
jgi:hypothetical protein